MASSEARGKVPSRRAKSKGGRGLSYQLTVNEDEAGLLRERAKAKGVTVQAFLFDAAMNASIETRADRQAAIGELFAIRRLMGNIANNVNQLAKFANTESVLPAEAEAIIAEYRATVPLLQAAARKL
jgi:hypothetical protein